MTQAPILTGREIGEAARATGALLDRLLSGTGADLPGWVALNVMGTTGSVVKREELAERIMFGLKVDASSVATSLTQLIQAGLVSDANGAVELTSAGAATFEQVRDGIAAITQRIYGDLPAEDQAVAQRVLAAVTARANAELAS